MHQIYKEDMRKREEDAERLKKKLDKPPNLLIAAYGSLVNLSLPIDNNPKTHYDSTPIAEIMDNIKSESDEKEALFKCDPKFTNCKVKPDEIDHLFEIMSTKKIVEYKKELKKGTSTFRSRESGLPETTDSREENKMDQEKLCYDSLSKCSPFENYKASSSSVLDFFNDSPNAKDVQSCSHENTKLPSLPQKIEHYEGQSKIKIIEKEFEKVQSQFKENDSMSKNPSSRSQWLLKSFFNIAAPKPNAKNDDTDEPLWYDYLLSLKNGSADVLDQCIDAETTIPRSIAATTKVERIARIAIFCPISMCQKEIDVSKFLSHFLTNHKCIREVYAGRKIILNDLNVTENLGYGETVCLCCAAYAGLDKGICLHQSQISVCNQDLPQELQHWKGHVPVLVLMHKTSWSSFNGKHQKRIIEKPHNKDSHIYILWLVSAQTISPIFANVRIFEEHQIGAQSKRILCRDIGYPQIPADFIRKDGNYLLVQQNELDLLQNKMRIEVIFDEDNN